MGDKEYFICFSRLIKNWLDALSDMSFFIVCDDEDRGLHKEFVFMNGDIHFPS